MPSSTPCGRAPSRSPPTQPSRPSPTSWPAPCGSGSLPGCRPAICRWAEGLRAGVADGQVRVKSFAIDTREGRATGIASLDLKALTFDSQWRLEAKAGSGAGGKALPAVTVVYRGPGRIAGHDRAAHRLRQPSSRSFPRARSSATWRSWSACAGSTSSAGSMEAERLRKQFEQPPPGQRPPPGVPHRALAGASRGLPRRGSYASV